ncbi:MAG TPA: hypothetical protein VF008_24700 [Niastella sp.]
MADIITALVAGIKLASCLVNYLYGKSSFRENEKDDKGTAACNEATSDSQEISAKEKMVTPGYANQ